VLAGAAVGLVVTALVLTLWPVFRAGSNADIDAVILGARALAVRRNPYVDSWRYVGPGWPWPLQYPAPAIVTVLPLALLPLELGRALFIGIGLGLLTYAVTRDAWWPIVLLVSGPVAEAAFVGQWSPLVTAGSLLPALAWVLACKPNLGISLWVGSPDRQIARRLALGALAAIAVSLLVFPGWPRSYFDAVSHSPHRSLILRPFGWLLLAALTDWRNPSARVLAALALIPQSGTFYDGLPALLAARRSWEAFLLSALSLIGYLLSMSRDRTMLSYPAIVAQGWPYVLVGLYLPALALVLARAWRRRRSASAA
jgi:hypothetical protein